MGYILVQGDHGLLDGVQMVSVRFHYRFGHPLADLRAVGRDSSRHGSMVTWMNASILYTYLSVDFGGVAKEDDCGNGRFSLETVLSDALGRKAKQGINQTNNESFTIFWFFISEPLGNGGEQVNRFACCTSSRSQ
jgi:hypothetical protein